MSAPDLEQLRAAARALGPLAAEDAGDGKVHLVRAGDRSPRRFVVVGVPRELAALVLAVLLEGVEERAA